MEQGETGEMTLLLHLFFEFFKVGLFAVGGGMVILLTYLFRSRDYLGAGDALRLQGAGKGEFLAFPIGGVVVEFDEFAAKVDFFPLHSP